MRTPPFCPNSQCPKHYHTSTRPNRWWVRDGCYISARAGRTQRFRCISCGRKFSAATFSTEYFTKKRVNLPRLQRLLVNGSSVRAAARQMFVSPTTITHRIMLLCRQSVALHGELIDTVVPEEDLVADGFQSFWVSQYHPNHFNLLAGADSQYLYALSSVTLRRSGRMTPKQQQKRDDIEARFPPEPRALEWSFGELMDEGGRLWERMAPADRVLRSDEHPTYPGCLAQCGTEAVTHITVNSRLARNRENPLFAVNYLDREIRKDLAEHHRETVCFARNSVVSTARMWIYMVQHNVDKAFRICPRNPISHAEEAGIAAREVRRVRRHMLTRRAFLRRSRLGHLTRTLWAGMIPTPERIPWENRRLIPAYTLS